MKADVLITGGRVIDPARGIDEIRNVAVQGMRIVDPGTDEVQSSHMIDASGCIVAPGLIDFHTHVFYDGSNTCIHPDLMIPQGTTATVDAGSAGTATFEAFYKTAIVPSSIRLKGFLTVYSGGQLDCQLWKQ